MQSRASAPAARLCAPARRSPPGGGPSREPAHRVPAAAAGAASSPELPRPRLASSSRSPSPAAPQFSKVAPHPSALSPDRKAQRSGKLAHLVGSGAGPGRQLLPWYPTCWRRPLGPQAAPSRAPPERGRRRSAVSSARQRRGARAIPGERDAGHGRARGGAGARAGGRAGRGAAAAAGGEEAAPPGPRRRSSRAGPAERTAPPPLAAAPGRAAPPSSPPRGAGRPCRPAPGEGAGAGGRRAGLGRGEGRSDPERGARFSPGARPVPRGPGGNPTGTALNSSHLLGPMSPQPPGAPGRAGWAGLTHRVKCASTGRPPPPPAPHRTAPSAQRRFPIVNRGWKSIRASATK